MMRVITTVSSILSASNPETRHSDRTVEDPVVVPAQPFTSKGSALGIAFKRTGVQPLDLFYDLPRFIVFFCCNVDISELAKNENIAGRELPCQLKLGNRSKVLRYNPQHYALCLWRSFEVVRPRPQAEMPVRKPLLEHERRNFLGGSHPCSAVVLLVQNILAFSGAAVANSCHRH